LLSLAVLLAGVYALHPEGTYGERQIRLALSAQRDQRYPDALRHLDLAIAAEPENARAFFLRGRVNQQLGSLDAAMTAYREADRREPTGPTKACLAYCLGRQRAHAEAVQYARQAVEQGYAPAAVFNNLGYSFLLLSQLEAAEANLTQAMRLDPRLQAAYHNRARLDRKRMTTKQGYLPHQGIADIRKAMELGPVSADLFHDGAYLCAFAARLESQWQEPALDYLEKALALGLDPQLVVKNPVFNSVNSTPRFLALVQLPPVANRYQPVLLLIDPIPTGE